MTSAQGSPTPSEQPVGAQASQPPPPPSIGLATEDTEDSGVGRRYVGANGIAILAIVIVALMALITYSLVAIWPVTTATPTVVTTHLFGFRLVISSEQRLFMIVALSGALGGLIHSARSLYWYAGNRVLRRSWLLMYVYLPFIGSALAVVFYVILRGGLLTGEATAAQVNFFGFAATSALVGLFSPEAAEKLKQVFDTLLAPAESGRDRVPITAEPTVESIEPQSVKVGTIISIHGQNLSGSTAVLFHGARAPVSTVEDATVTVQVPKGASTGPIRLAVGTRIVNIPGVLHVDLKHPGGTSTKATKPSDPSPMEHFT
jgi:hypothetical protein